MLSTLACGRSNLKKLHKVLARRWRRKGATDDSEVWQMKVVTSKNCTQTNIIGEWVPVGREMKV